MGNWKYTLRGFEQIFETEDLTERSDKIAASLGQLNNRMLNQDDRAAEELRDLIEDFRIYGAEDGESYFETLMENLYDWADEHRVWIEPRSRVSG